MQTLISKILEYVLQTPENTNYLVLLSLLQELIYSTASELNFKINTEDEQLYVTCPDTQNFSFDIDENGYLIYERQ